MGFPAKLRDMNLTLDSVGFMGVSEEVTLPKFSVKMEEWRGAGMLGPIKIDTGLNAIDLEFTMGGLVDTPMRQFGAGTYDAAQARFNGAYQDQSTGLVRAVQILAHGRYEEIDLGNAKVGSETQHKYKMACAYYCLAVDGANWIEIDLMARTFIVFGGDRYAAITAALGA